MVIDHGDPALSIQSARYVMDDVRRAREFYKYLQPDNLVLPHLRRRSSTFDGHHEHVPSLSTALAPFCQLMALRCNATKAMLNVMDREVMYFLAESSRKRRSDGHEEMYDFVEDPIFLSCSSVPLKGRICEMTIRNGRTSDEEAPLFVIPDLTKSQFAQMSIVTGPPHFRFYAGAPITTRDGINIGSVAIMDTKIRPEGLTQPEEEFLSQVAQQIMTYLETNRQAIEGRRSRRMAKGLEGFIAGKGSIHEELEDARKSIRPTKRTAAYGLPSHSTDDMPLEEIKLPTRHPRYDHRNLSIASVDSAFSTSELSTEAEEPKESSEIAADSRSHSKIFARAANLLRECMGSLGEDGSVCFHTLKPRFGGDAEIPPSSKRSQETTPEPIPMLDRTDSLKINAQAPATAAKVIAFSSQADPFGTSLSTRSQPAVLTEAMLEDLMRRHPNGHLWSLDDGRSSSSEEETRNKSMAPNHRRRSKRRQTELDCLRETFPGARQVLFAPLWDATIGSSAHGVFVTTALETRSFSVTSELSFLNAFCSTLMAECSRLDTMLADKQKSDFVGTISHEMRSPLHGILASVEFLGETDVTGFQKSLIDTVDSCGRTLLDTINHVLDFSKVNSFQKQWQASNKRLGVVGRRNHYLGPEQSSSLTNGAPPLLQLFAVTDISAVLEEVVEGLVLGNTYNSGIDITDTSREARGRGTGARSSQSGRFPVDPIDIILNIEYTDWAFMTQPGAVRRIIMNITGNAIKYTSHGTITVSLKLQETIVENETTHSMVLSVTDTGKGISPEFLATRLFVPFAQENALAPGTGLGMSIVRSIVLMLGGSIDVRSTVGKGTTVEVVLPMKRPLPGQLSTQSTPDSTSSSHSGSSNSESIMLLQNQAADATVTFYRQTPRQHDERAKVVQRYVHDWYHLQFVDQRMVESASVVAVEEDDLEFLIEKAVGTPGRRPAIVVLCSVTSRHSAAQIKSLEDRISSAVEFVAKPIGPYKLARSIRSALEKKKYINPRFPQVTALGVIPEADTPHHTMSTPAGTEAVNSRLSEMNLNKPGESQAVQIVQATETFAASQSSSHAQMAITDPRPSIQTPQNQASEGDAFPFPTQDDERSRQRRESHRTNSFPVKSPGPFKITPDPLKTPRPLNNDRTIKNDQWINPHILLVDDNKINLKLLETFLKAKRKYTRIAQAEDGKQAVDIFAAATEPFDIVFMDISMPVMNGFEATRAIRKYEDRHNAKPGAMVIALTGLASGRDQSEGFDSGCDIYMTKPVSFREVGKLLDNWEEHQKLNTTSDAVTLPSDTSGSTMTT